METKIGELAVRRSIEINASPERVWEEFTSTERMRLWYSTAGGVEMPCKRLEMEPWVGGKFETEGDHGDITFRFTGSVLVYDPPREMTVEMNPVHVRLPAGMLLTFALTPLERDRTRAEIIQHGFERFGESGRNLYEAFERGWDLVPLEALKALIEDARS